MRQWGAGAGGKDAVSLDDYFFRMLMGWALDGERIHSSSGAPQASTTIDDYSLGSVPVSLMRIYPATDATIVLAGVVPQRAGQILLITNDNVGAGEHFVMPTADGALGASAAQNQFAQNYDWNGGTPVNNFLAIPGGNIAAFRYFGPIGVNGRWRELWAASGCGRVAPG